MSAVPHKRRQLTLKVSMALVVLVMFDFAASQILTRFARKDPTPVKQHGLPYGYSLRPNLDVVSAMWGHRRYRLRTNSQGFRDARMRHVTRQSAGHRIAFIGDSFTMGIGCDYEDTFVGLVSDAFSDHGVEVLNAAVDGYSTMHYSRKIIHAIESGGLELSEVICCIDLSDVAEDLARASSHARITSEGQRIDDAPRARPRIRLPHLPHTASMKSWLRRHSLVVEVLYRVKLRFSPSLPVDQRAVLWTSDESLFQEFGSDGIALQMEYLNALRAVLGAHGVKLTIVVYPWADQILRGDLDSRQVNIWRDWTKDNDCGFINVFPYFIPQNDPMAAVHRYFIRGDNHFNEAGHAIVAQAILDHFASREKSEQSTVTSDQ